MTSGGLLAQLDGALGFNVPREQLEIEFVKELTESEAAALRPARTKQQDLRVLRQSHHQLAKLLAQGRSPGDCALITGYTLGAIENLRNNGVFVELIGSYKVTEELIAADLAGQEAVLKFATLAKLQRLLEAEPEDGLKEFTIGQLQDQLKVLQSKVAGGPGFAPGGFAPSVNVSFVQGSPKGSGEAPIEVDYREEPPR
jgi:hypothetical protein